MHKSLLSLALPLMIATGGATPARAQTMPTTQPMFLHIVREQVKVGRSGEHSRWEAGWPAAFEKAKFPDIYIALQTVTGHSEVWYVEAFASQAAYGESSARQDADPVLSAETGRLLRGDAEFVSEVTQIQAVARPDLSHGTFPDLATMRFWAITTFKVKPGHDDDFAAAAKAWASASARSAPSANWRTYEVVAGAPGGTFLVFGSVASFGEFDKEMASGEATYKGLTFDERSALNKFDTEASLGTVTNRFRLDPRQSYVPAETRQKDPAFWMPKAASPAKKKP